MAACVPWRSSRSESIGTQYVYRARRLHLTNKKPQVKFIHIELSLCVKSQKSHSEFQVVKTEVEHTIFAIAAMFV